MLFKNLLVASSCLFLSGTILGADVAAAPRISVICSHTMPGVEGFELVRVGARKSIGKSEHRSHRGDHSYQATYTRASQRLNVRVVKVDEDGEEGRFLASLDIKLPPSEYVRMILGTSANEGGEAAEPNEVVCNAIAAP